MPNEITVTIPAAESEALDEQVGQLMVRFTEIADLVAKDYEEVGVMKAAVAYSVLECLVNSLGMVCADTSITIMQYREAAESLADANIKVLDGRESEQDEGQQFEGDLLSNDPNLFAVARPNSTA